MNSASKAKVLTLKHESRILGQLSNPVCGSWKSQEASYPCSTEPITCSIMEMRHTGLDDCLRILLSCFKARISGRKKDLFGYYPVQTFLAVGRTGTCVSAVFLAVPLEHLALDFCLHRFTFFGDGPFWVRNLCTHYSGV